MSKHILSSKGAQRLLDNGEITIGSQLMCFDGTFCVTGISANFVRLKEVIFDFEGQDDYLGEEEFFWTYTDFIGCDLLSGRREI